jgi:hypothetical protein
MICRFPLLTVLLSIALTACSSKSNPQDYTTAQPNFDEMVGAYVPTTATLDLLKATGKYERSDSTITLKDDGTVEITDVPDWWLTSYTEAKGKFDNGKGKWGMDRNKGWWMVVMSFTTQNNSFSSPVPKQGNVTAMLSIIGQKAPYRLQLSIADPNAEIAMEFEKKPSS